jgi:hypothetical protein
MGGFHRRYLFDAFGYEAFVSGNVLVCEVIQGSKDMYLLLVHAVLPSSAKKETFTT